MSVVEQYARVRIVTDADPRLEEGGAATVVLRYDPEDDPLCVRFGLPGAVSREWAVERELLERGLRAPVTSGGIRVWPCGRVQTVVEFHTSRSVSVVEFENKTLTRFLLRTYAAAAQPVPH